MSLTPRQVQETKKAFHDNIQLSQLSFKQIAKDLNTTPEHILAITRLEVQAIEDPWILKIYLEDYITSQNIEPIPFSALSGDYRSYWFLDKNKIDKKELSR